MIEVNGLTKEFGTFRAVDNVSFQVPKGQVLGFLGPNGAGKSTTMKMLTCFISPTRGSAKIGGYDITKETIKVAEMLGYLPEGAPSYGEMTVCEFLKFVAEVRGKRGSARDVAADRVKEICFLSSVWHQQIDTLSKGYRQRVGFAQALIHDPEILVLDEPTDGLDPNQKHEMRQLISRMGEAGKTIILSTHILEEVDAVCNRVIIIANGRLVADATPANLAERSVMHNAVTVSFSQNIVEQARSSFGQDLDVARVEVIKAIPNTIRVFPKNGKAILTKVSGIAREKNWEFQQIHVEHGRLDEVFRRVTIDKESVQ
jgi:ABC-2 type transport system ATP-binding protein